MESIYLKTLIEVARTGNLTKAAETLCVTQSAVSRRIKFLETQYGCDLIDRSGQILVLTAQGSLVREKAEKIMAIEQELKAELCLPDANRDISFVCTPTFGIIHLPHVMREFMLSCPENNNLNFVFKMPDQIVSGLKDGCYDMAVIEHCKCFDLSDFETIELQSDEMIFAAAPSLGLVGEQQPIEKILHQTLYARSEGCCSRTLLEANLGRLSFGLENFNRIVTYDDLHIIIRALIDGLGIGFISNELIAPYVERGELNIFRVSDFTHKRQRTLISNAQYLSNCPATQFISILREKHS